MLVKVFSPYPQNLWITLWKKWGQTDSGPVIIAFSLKRIFFRHPCIVRRINELSLMCVLGHRVVKTPTYQCALKFRLCINPVLFRFVKPFRKGDSARQGSRAGSVSVNR